MMTPTRCSGAANASSAEGRFTDNPADVARGVAQSTITTGERWMSKVIRTTVLLAGLMLAATSFAQTPANAPSGATGQCKDGSYWTNATKKGACSGHEGVQTWYGSPDAGTASGPPPPAAAAAAA